MRFDDVLKRDRYLTDVLGQWLTWVPARPELEIGLGIPRPTTRLENAQPGPRLVEPKSGLDLTDKMQSKAGEKDGRLNDSVLRERFIAQVFCRNRWRGMGRKSMTRRGLVAFHTAYKLQLRSHNESAYRRLGRIVASARTMPDSELFLSYEDELHTALSSRPSSKRRANVLYHALGYLNRALDPFEKQELVQLIED